MFLSIHCPYLRRRHWHPTPVLLPGKSHGQRSLVGCGPWGLEESDTTEWLPFHFSLSCIGEGNGNPLQCSCLENPRDGESGRLPSMGSHRVGHDWSNLACMHDWRRKWQPAPVFLPGESQGRGDWWAAVYGVAQSRTRLKWLSSSSSSQARLGDS